MSNNRKGKYFGKNSPVWRGGSNVTFYDTYASQLEWCEEVRRSPTDRNILEVKCFKCNKWYIPNRQSITHRISSLNNKRKGYDRLYCSEECKKSCSIYNKSPNQLMKEDAIRAGRLSWLKLDREVQPELRKMVLERDGYTYQKCGKQKFSPLPPYLSSLDQPY